MEILRNNPVSKNQKKTSNLSHLSYSYSLSPSLSFPTSAFLSFLCLFSPYFHIIWWGHTCLSLTLKPAFSISLSMLWNMAVSQQEMILLPFLKLWETESWLLKLSVTMEGRNERQHCSLSIMPAGLSMCRPWERDRTWADIQLLYIYHTPIW